MRHSIEKSPMERFVTERDRRNRFIRQAEFALERELERQEIIGRDLGRLVYAVKDALDPDGIWS